jgi:transglutaminase-like putative cysteine protease
MSFEPISATFQIRHVTGFNYDGVADSSYNEARMTPVTLARQQVLESSITVHPFAVQSTYRDYFGTIVTTFDLQQRHHRLQVVAEATVKTVDEPASDADISLRALHHEDIIDRYAEYLAPTPRTTMSPEVLDELESLVAGQERVHDVANTVTDWVRERVAYVRGATQVSSTAQDVWEQREGVCQDLTHVTISLLRQLGIPSRYVSGYLYSKEDDHVGEKVVGESHAWVEYFCGDWAGVDPTNGGPIGLHHVTVAKGREYGDVPPLKGIYHGDPSSALGVVVELTRVA